MLHRLSILLGAVLAFAPQSAVAQVLVWETQSPVPWAPSSPWGNLVFGAWVFDVKDADADGFDEVLVSNPFADNGSTPLAGWVGVLSGATGQLVRSWIGTTAMQQLFSCGSAGDVDGDGAGDVGVKNAAGGAPYYGYYSVANGALLSQWFSGGPPCSANFAIPNGHFRVGSDLDGDGLEESFAAAPNMVTLREGTSATALWTAFVADGATNFGWDVQSIDDFDGDGFRDVLAGAPGLKCLTSTSPALYRIGRARVLSGWDGSLLAEYLGDALCDYFGQAVAAVGDVDGDGVQDFVATQHGLGLVKTVSGANGTTIFSSLMGAPPAGSNDLPRATEVGDVDGDGSGDFALRVFGAPSAPSWVEIRRGVDHGLIFAIPQITIAWPGVPPFQLSAGVSLTYCGDEDGDGFGELLVGYAGVPVTESGRIRRYSLRPPGVGTFGVGCTTGSGAPPRIGATGSPSLGHIFTTTLSQARTGSSAILVAGFSNAFASGVPLPASLSAIGLPGCSLLVSPDVVLTIPTVPQAGTTVGASASMSIPSVPTLIGLNLYAQWAATDALDGSVGLTRGLAAAIQP